MANCSEVFSDATSPPAGDSGYLHVKVRVEVRLLHKLFNLSTALHKLTDFLGKNSHLEVRVRKLRNFVRVLILSEPRKERTNHVKIIHLYSTFNGTGLTPHAF